MIAERNAGPDRLLGREREIGIATEEIAGTSDLEVQRGHAEPAAKITELLDRGEALARHGRQRLLWRHEQVRIGGPI